MADFNHVRYYQTRPLPRATRRKRIVEPMWDEVASAAGSAWNAGTSAASSVVNTVVDVVEDVVDEVDEFIDDATGFAVRVGDRVGEGIHTFVVTAEGLYQDAMGTLHRVGDAIGNYVLDVTGKVVNEFGEAWDSLENAARKTADMLENGVEDLGNGLTRVGAFIVDGAGHIVDAVGEFIDDAWTAAMNAFMDLMCDNAGTLATGVGIAGSITGIAGCVATSTAISAAIIFLGGGPENLVADQIAATISALYLYLCSAAVAAKGVYSVPEIAGDIQANTCRNAPVINWMRNSLLKNARIWSYYDPIFNWAPDWLKQGLCELANPICAASGFHTVATSGADCLAKGAAGAAAIALLTGGAFNPATDAIGLMLGATIAGICEAGVMAGAGYGMDKCVGDMQVSYCPTDANMNTIIPPGKEDKTQFSQYSKHPLTQEEMDAGQLAQRTNPNYTAALTQAAAIGSAGLGAANAALPDDSQITAGSVATFLDERRGGAPVVQTVNALNTTRNNVMSPSSSIAIRDAHTQQYATQLATQAAEWQELDRQHPNVNVAPPTLSQCVQTPSVGVAKQQCNAVPDCDGFWRTPAGRTCYKKKPFNGMQPMNIAGSFYIKPE